tara:strand:- start:5941 stop:6495 length:555 start_codon:yes stop_codon:yes gene_type:complete
MLPVEFNCQGEVYCLRHFRPFVMDVAGPGDDARVYKVRIAFATSHCFTRKRAPEDRPDVFVDALGDARSFCPERYERSKNIQEVFVWASAGRVFFSDEHRARERRFLVVKSETGCDPLVIPFEAEPARMKGVDVVLHVVSAYPAPHDPRLSQKVYFPTLIAKTARGEIVQRPNPHGRRGRGGRR